MSTSTLTPFANRSFSNRGAEILFGAAPPPKPRDPDAWQKLIGEKSIGARLDMLPERQTNWRALATSTFTQVGIVVVLVLLQVFIPEKLITTIEYNVMPLAGPMVEIPQAKPQPVKPKPLPPPLQTPQQHVPKLVVPRIAPVVVRPKPQEVRPVDVPKVEQAAVMPNLNVPDSGPVRPIEVKTGVLGDSPAGGGFGDPHGLPGAADPSKRVNIAHLGGFNNEVGPGYGSRTGNGTGVSGNSGRGNGNGVAGAGFGGGSAFATDKTEGPKAVEKSGFQSAEVAPQAAPKPKTAASEPPPTTSVELLSKPNPQYTDEARRLGIEGEVLLNVVFLASGQVKVEGVSRGLGHGLDEAAVRAAQQIRFKPAIQDGHAVDFPAVIHIVFQLAF
jgi:TonB family protein